MTEDEALLTLNAIPGLGNARITQLLTHYGSACNVLGLSAKVLREDRAVSEKIIPNILQFPKDKFLKNEYNLIHTYNIKIINIYSSEYPEILRQIPDAPVILYVKGDVPKNGNQIGIVGSRKASFYGLDIAHKFGQQLAQSGVIVVSGMARGIDTAAHKGSLKEGGLTVAVLGCGLAHVYPPENKDLLEEIAASGAVLSEYPMQRPPIAQNFPRRNRIVSGLSLGVIVVEAAQRSGALITADCALEQGREVYAVPGKIDAASSGGVNNLIKQGAKLITSIEDVLEDLNVALSVSQDKRDDVVPKNRIAKNLTDDEQMVYQHIQDQPVHIDELSQLTKSNISVTGKILLQLELKSLVRQLPGKVFTKR